MKSMRCQVVKPLIMIAAFFLIFQALPARSQGPASSPGKPALYEFGSGLCLSCKEMEKILGDLKAQYGGQVEVRLVYADKEKDLFKQYKIMLIPTQVFLDASGQEVGRHIGPLTREEVIQKLKELKFIAK